MRICKKCQCEKPLDQFTKDKRREHGRGSWCKSCHNGRHWENREINNAKCKQHYLENKPRYQMYRRLKKYGVTQEQYSQMLENQNGLCCICKAELDQGKNTCVDHCHTTGKVRGILCSPCNLALGHFKDSIELLKFAICYLEGRQC